MHSHLILGTVLAVMTTLALAWKWQLGILRAGVFILAQSMLTAVALSALDPVAHFSTLTGTIAMWGITVLGAAVWVLAVFYRDPERTAPDRRDVIVSPADGVVIYLKSIPPGAVPVANKKGHPSLLRELQGTSLCESGAVAVGISMNLADVHVNRAPIAGRVRLVKRVPGSFGSLRKPGMADSNERLTTVIGTGDLQVAMVQIASRLVRRIVTFVSEGDELRLGQRTGAIRFGSQVDLILPLEKDIVLAVDVGDRLVAGRTIVGVVANAPATANARTRTADNQVTDNPQVYEVSYVTKGRRFGPGKGTSGLPDY
jgi:phosphatidylserine decarboxylase